MASGLFRTVFFTSCLNLPLHLFQSIYNEEISREGFEASALLSKETARKAMYEARVKKIPSCPEDLGEAIKLLEDGEVPADILASYLGHVTWNETRSTAQTKTHHALLIGDKNLFNTVTSQSNFFFADGTFGCTPRQARSISVRGSQVFSIVADFHDKAVCILTVVMTSRKLPMYKLVLKKLKEIFPDFKPARLMADYEPAMRKAFTKEFPETRLLGCRH